MKLTVAEAARLAGVAVPSVVPAKCFCPLRKHKRTDKTFRVFKGADGKDLWKCWSCDDPENAGDALKLYCILTGKERKAAWNEMRERGYDVGQKTDDSRIYRPSTYVSAAPVTPRRFVETRRVPSETLALDMRQLELWKANDMARVEEYLRSRGIPHQAWHEWGILSMGGDYMGFLYRDPDTGRPCRVKVRGMREKRFWNEPRASQEKPDAKAKAPLWLADRLVPGKPAILVEGEVDALSLAVLGLPNVISLPDGAESAATVDLTPLRDSCDLWIVATDDDEPGEKAWQTLLQRAQGTGHVAVRRRWSRDDGASFKDANEALQAGFGREDFLRCITTAEDDGELLEAFA